LSADENADAFHGPLAPCSLWTSYSESLLWQAVWAEGQAEILAL
jgi:hypothetical protein